MEINNLDIHLTATLIGHQNPVYTLAIANDSQTLYSGGTDKGVVEWDMESMKFKRILCKVGSSVYYLFQLPDSNILAIGLRSGQLLLVDTVEQRLVANLQTEQGGIFNIQYLKDKNELIAIGEEGMAYVWSLKDYSLLYRFRVSETTVRVMALAEDNEVIAFGDKNGWVYLHDSNDFHLLCKAQLHELPVTSLLFSNGSLLSGGRDAKLNRSNPADLSIIKTIIPHLFTVYGIVKTEGIPLIATASRDKTIKVWREEDLSLLKNISRDKGMDSHMLSINSLIWDKNKLITGSDDKTIKIWTLDSL